MFKFIFLNTKKIPNIQDIYKRFKKLISDVSINSKTYKWFEINIQMCFVNLIEVYQNIHIAKFF